MWLFDLFRLEKRLSECERIVAAVEKQNRDLDLDAQELYERCRNMLKRTARERSRIEAATPGDEPAAAAPTNGEVTRTPTGGFLSERQKAIQSQILRRRAGG
jgi:hypothetical protein